MAGRAIINGDSSGFGQTEIDAGNLSVLTMGPSGQLGAVRLNGGTMRGLGTVGAITSDAALGGRIEPGSSVSSTIGKLNAYGNVTFSNATTFAVEIGGPTVETEYDQLNVTGTINIGAGINSLSGALINGFTPAAGQQFTIIHSTGALTGTFAQGNSITIGGVRFAIAYNSNSVVLSTGSAFPWHISANPLDVVGSGSVTPDGQIAAGDALAIINYINAINAGQGGEGESFSIPHSALRIFLTTSSPSSPSSPSTPPAIPPVADGPNCRTTNVNLHKNT